jgi:hypothetical protein
MELQFIQDPVNIAPVLIEVNTCSREREADTRFLRLFGTVHEKAVKTNDRNEKSTVG